MRYILDTHALIWFITDHRDLPKTTGELIKSADNECVVSAASMWEMAVKVSLGKLDLKTDLKNIFEIITQSRIDILPITSEHILEVAELPFHHRDPFDRMLIAQGRTEKMMIITKDGHFERYEVETVWNI